MRVFFDRLFLWFSFKFATCFNFCDLLQFLFPFLGILVIHFILHVLVIQFHFFSIPSLHLKSSKTHRHASSSNPDLSRHCDDLESLRQQREYKF